MKRKSKNFVAGAMYRQNSFTDSNVGSIHSETCSLLVILSSKDEAEKNSYFNPFRYFFLQSRKSRLGYKWMIQFLLQALPF
jgi:hypothetical protein